MKTILQEFLCIALFVLLAPQTYSQWLFTANPPTYDYCNGQSQPITLTVNSYNSTHKYVWSIEDNSQFEYTGVGNFYAFDSGQTVTIYPGYNGLCYRIQMTEYDSAGNYLNPDYMVIGSSNGGIPAIPVYYNSNGCQNIQVPDAYSVYAVQANGRWSMWYKDGVATGVSDYNFVAPSAGNYEYKLKLICGDTIASNMVQVYDNIASPVVTASGNTTFCNGDTVLLNVQTTYNTYQWKRNGVNISGATTGSYKATQSGSYTIAVLNYNYCQKESTPITVTVQSGAFITSPTSVACAGDSIQLTCTTGNSFVWKRNGNIIAGANTQSIYVKTSGTYKVETTGLTCNTSKNKVITFYAYPTITTNVAGSISICNGTGITLTAFGNNISTYQWFKNGDTLVGGNTPSIYISKTGTYKCNVGNQIGCSKTSAKIIVVNTLSSTLPTKTIVLQPSANGIDAYIESYFPGQSTNYGNASFMELSNWYKYFRTADRGLLKFDLSAIPQGANIMSATLKLYVDSVDAFTNAAQHLILKTITQSWNENSVTFNTAPLYSEYQSVTVPHNVIANKTFFNVSISDFVNYWVNDSSQNKGMMILLDEFVMPVCWLRISSGDNVVTSQHPKLTVKYAYAAIDTNGTTTFCSGDSVVFSTNSGSYSYQWYQNSVAIAGATILTFSAKTSGDYFVVISNATGCTVSSAIKHVTVNPKPGATITALSSTTFCNGDSVKLQANNGTNLTYQWLKNNSSINNATSKIYTAKTAGVYKVRVTNVNGCKKISSATNVNVPCKTLVEGESVNTTTLKIFPNPSADDFEIVITDEIQIDKLLIYDLDGRLIESYYHINSGFRFGKDLDRGVYSLQINTDEKMFYRKVVKL